MVFSTMQAVAFNLNRQQHNLKFFEFGKVYLRDGDENKENNQLAICVTGNVAEESWNAKNREADHFYLKALVQNILSRLGLHVEEKIGASNEALNGTIEFGIKKNLLGSMGYVNDELLTHFDIKKPVLMAILEWDKIIELIAAHPPVFKEIPKFPEVRRDLALLVDDAVNFEEIKSLAQNTEKKLLKQINLFDVYTGSKLPKGKKSYAVSFILGDDTKTLTDKQIDKVMNKLQKRFEEELGAQLR